MKIFSLVSAATVGFILQASAISIPSNFHSLSEIEKAKAEAAEKEEPLILVFTDEKLQPT